MTKTLVVNAGSSSLKFQLLEMPEENVITEGLIERIGVAGEATEPNVTIKYGDGQKHQETAAFDNHEEAVSVMLEQLINLKVIDSYDEIKGVGHRVVAGGEWFNKSVVITDDVLEKIDRLAAYAPLHNPANAMGIRATRKLIPDAVQVAAFDTSFHQTMPQENYLYGLPYQYYTQYGARKYGAHGTSHRYVAGRAAEMLGKPLEQTNVITLHLGAGASITAIKDGKSYDTSMGFTPLAGLMMATRTGDIDPSLVYYIQEKEVLSNEEMLAILNGKSGLLGISTISADMRNLLDVEDTNDHAKLAITMWVDRVVEYIAKYYFELEGKVDALVFTAGIGENSQPIREHILQRLAFLGVEIDEEANKQRGHEIEVTTANSKLKAFMIPTDEELMIARDVEALKG